MQQGLAAYRATGAELYRPYYLALLAEGYGKGGQAEEGLRVLAEALAAVDSMLASASGKQSSIGSKGNCCWPMQTQGRRGWRRRPVSTRRLR